MFARHFGKSPAVLGLEDIRDYQLYLTNQKKLDARSIQVAVSALRFLYRVTLKQVARMVRCLMLATQPRKCPHLLGTENDRQGPRLLGTSLSYPAHSSDSQTEIVQRIESTH